MQNKKWIQETGITKHKGALHRQLGVSSTKKLPPKLLTDIAKAHVGTKVRGHTVTTLLKRRVNLAKNLQR